MQKTSHLVIACLLLGSLAGNGAQAGSAIVGVNVYDKGFVSLAARNADIKRLADSGVQTIRIDLGTDIACIVQAFQHGIGSVVVVVPSSGSKVRAKAPRTQVPLSEINPQQFADWLKPVLDRLDAAGVRLTAIELGNEINTPGFNADVPTPGTGRVLGLSDLKNPNDPEGRAVADSYRAYLRILEALKELRDQTKLNNTTPIISAGLADWGLPSPRSWNKQLGVSLPDTLAFLRQNGLDRLVDGYGVHVYPSGDRHRSIGSRIASLERYVLSECRQDTKPCWLTEWGFSNPSRSCPIDDAARREAIEAQRSAFKQFVDQGRLAALIYSEWTGLPGKKDEAAAIFRCGGLTDAGRVALGPM